MIVVVSRSYTDIISLHTTNINTISSHNVSIPAIDREENSRRRGGGGFRYKNTISITI